MNVLRIASFLLACASSGSLGAAAVTASIPAVLASAAVLALSCASCRALGLRDRIAVLGEPYAAVRGMAAGGVTRRAYVRDAVLDDGEEAAA